MKLKLTVTALGLAFAFGSASSMASSEAWVSQTGNGNDAFVEQADNTNAGAYITVTGSFNDTSIEQSRSTGVNGTINVTGWAFGNEAVIVTNRVSTGDAMINQGANMGQATIQQNGTSGWRGPDAENLYATINQNSGWNNDAWITQSGKNQDAMITQSGKSNK